MIDGTWNMGHGTWNIEHEDLPLLSLSLFFPGKGDLERVSTCPEYP